MSIENVINRFAYDVHDLAREKGWYDNGPRNPGELIALIHSELSEALEALREGNPDSSKIEASCLEEELADVIIRVCDMAEHMKLDLGRAVYLKHEHNKDRSYRHGGKKF